MRGSSLDGYRDLPWLQPLLPQQWLSLWPLPLPLLPLLQPLLSPPLSLLPLPSLLVHTTAIAVGACHRFSASPGQQHTEAAESDGCGLPSAAMLVGLGAWHEEAAQPWLEPWP